MPNLANLPIADVQAGAVLWNTGFKNYLINGDFAINQRGFAGGALAAGVYGFDRWKAGTGGCTVSLSAGVMTHTSGPLVQVIEAPNLAGKTITVSVEGLSGGSLNVNVEGVTGVIAASAVRAGVTLNVPSTSTGNVTVTLTPASGTVTYKRVQVEVGSAATVFEWRPAQVEISLCQRYYEKSYDISVAPGTVTSVGDYAVYNDQLNSSLHIAGLSVVFKTTKRNSSTINTYSTVTGVSGKSADLVGAVDVNSGVSNIGNSGFFNGAQNAIASVSYNFQWQWTADSEL